MSWKIIYDIILLKKLSKKNIIKENKKWITVIERLILMQSPWPIYFTGSLEPSFLFFTYKIDIMILKIYIFERKKDKYIENYKLKICWKYINAKREEIKISLKITHSSPIDTRCRKITHFLRTSLFHFFHARLILPESYWDELGSW